MDYTLLEKAIALHEQEQQQQQSTPDCLMTLNMIPVMRK